eukprot:1149639-Pelagomonas_calceolata.AAC.2
MPTCLHATSSFVDIRAAWSGVTLGWILGLLSLVSDSVHGCLLALAHLLPYVLDSIYGCCSCCACCSQIALLDEPKVVLQGDGDGPVVHPGIAALSMPPLCLVQVALGLQ